MAGSASRPRVTGFSDKAKRYMLEAVERYIADMEEWCAQSEDDDVRANLINDILYLRTLRASLL